MKNLIFKETLIKNKQVLMDLFIIVFGVGSLFLNSTFSFNPIFISCLFLIYYSGLKALSIYCAASILFSMFSSFSFGLEISLIVLTYLATNYLLHKIKSDNKVKFLALILLDSFLVFLSLRYQFNYETIVNIVFFLSLQYIIIDSLGKLKETISYGSKCNTIQLSVSLLCIGSTFLFIPSIGVIFYRIIAFFVAYYCSKEENLLFLLFSCGVYGFILHYSLQSSIYILFPLFLMIILPKSYKIAGFLLSHVILGLLYPIYIFYNLQFYLGLIGLAVYLIINKPLYNLIFDVFMENNKNTFKESKELVIENYLNYVEKALTTEEYDENQYLSQLIKKENCQKCDHQKHCRIKNSISDYLKNKLTKSIKSEINAYCLVPNRMTLSLQNGYSSYRKDLQTKESYCRDRTQMRDTIEAIKRPLLNDIKKISIEEMFNDYGIEIIKCVDYKDRILIYLNKKTYETYPVTIEEIVSKYDSHFVLSETKYDALTSMVTLMFSLKQKRNIDVGEFTKSKISGFNGDNYQIFKLDDKQEIVLCDGMGSGENAEKNSKYLLNAFVSSLKIHQDYKLAIKDVNRLLRMRSQSDHYSTLDYAEIDLRTLVLTCIKAGSYASFLYRDGNIKIIPNNSLPLGIIDEVNITPNKYQLKIGDILFIMSDGIGERFEKCKKLISYENKSSLVLVREIYETISRYHQIEDDATIIAIKIL